MKTKDAGIYQHPSRWCLRWEHSDAPGRMGAPLPSTSPRLGRYLVLIPYRAEQLNHRSHFHKGALTAPLLQGPKRPASFALGPPGMQHRSLGSRKRISKATHLQEPVSSTTLWDTEAEEGEKKRDAEKRQLCHIPHLDCTHLTAQAVREAAWLE